MHLERPASHLATPKLTPPQSTFNHRPHLQADELLCPAHTWRHHILRDTSRILDGVFAPGREVHYRDELLEILGLSLWRLAASQ